MQNKEPFVIHGKHISCKKRPRLRPLLLLVRLASQFCSEDQTLASTQLKAIGPKKASGMPKELTKESACGLSSLQRFATSFLTAAALSVDKYPYRRNATSSSRVTKTYIDLTSPKISCKRKPQSRTTHFSSFANHCCSNFKKTLTNLIFALHLKTQIS